MSDFYITPEDIERAEKNGISERLLNQRVYVYRWQKEKAVTTPIRVTKKTGWKEYKEIAREHGVVERTFKNRRQKGWDALKAATTPPMSKADIQKLSLKARKKKRLLTDEQIQRAASNGISYHTLLARVKNYKWDVETAINTPVLTPEEVSRRANEASPFRKTMMMFEKKRA